MTGCLANIFDNSDVQVVGLNFVGDKLFSNVCVYMVENFKNDLWIITNIYIKGIGDMALHGGIIRNMGDKTDGDNMMIYSNNVHINI